NATSSSLSVTPAWYFAVFMNFPLSVFPAWSPVVCGVDRGGIKATHRRHQNLLFFVGINVRFGAFPVYCRN
ncbi:MAG: hypothetical protein PVF89_02655, partial [Lysobacterales bacterium]